MPEMDFEETGEYCPECGQELLLPVRNGEEYEGLFCPVCAKVMCRECGDGIDE